MLALYIILGVIALLIIIAIAIQRSLVMLKNRVDEAFTDLTVQLKRRSDLIPTLVEPVKRYATHESAVFELVSAVRAGLLNVCTDVKATAHADNPLEGTCNS